jgi:2-haloalkanoic acid dehalogenase type II
LTSNTITAICFDVGDTLIAYRRPMRILLQDFFIEHDEILKRDAITEAVDATNSRYTHLLQQVRTIEDERRMWLEVARDLLDVLLPRRRDLYPELAKWYGEGWKHFKVFRDAVPALKKLRENGYRLAVVSNWEPSLTVTLEQSGLSSYFETVVVSSIEGIWKPDPRLFKIALERMNVRPADVLSVGDHVERDVKAAWDAGMQGILLDRFDDYPQFSPRVGNLGELSTWLQLHNQQPRLPVSRAPVQ